MRYSTATPSCARPAWNSSGLTQLEPHDLPVRVAHDHVDMDVCDRPAGQRHVPVAGAEAVVAQAVPLPYPAERRPEVPLRRLGQVEQVGDVLVRYEHQVPK